jgi:hypothetical protein
MFHVTRWLGVAEGHPVSLWGLLSLRLWSGWLVMPYDALSRRRVVVPGPERRGWPSDYDEKCSINKLFAFNIWLTGITMIPE